MIPELLKPHFKQIKMCPLCASQEFKKTFEVKGLKISKCSQCGFRFMNPCLNDEGMGLLYKNSKILIETNPALESYYEYGVGNMKSKTYQDYVKVLSLLERVYPVSEKPKLFEIGYGSGAFLKEARERGWQVDGTDTSEDNFRLLTNEGVTVQLGSFDDFEVSSNKYQAVALWDVIEHTISPKDFIRKAYEMLVPGGLLVIVTPNVSGLLNKVSEFLYFVSFRKIKFGINQLYCLEHVGYFNQKNLKKLVEDEGFLFEKALLTETDLERYHFSPIVKFCLKIFFIAARIVSMANRIVVVAKKSEK